jgi:uncharacterized protein YukE/cell wall-associated NlpC family hydrolase
MSHKDDVSALPGNAPQLAALANPVYVAVSAGAFEDLANRFTEAGGKAAETTIRIKSVISDVDGIWAGPAADGFVNYMNGFTNAGLAVGDALTNAASDLQNAGAAVLGARNALEGVFANLVTEVRALDGEADSGEAESKVNEAVERHRPQVVEQLDVANQALTTAASTLAELPNELKTPFSALGEPNTGATTPSGGPPVEAPPETPAPAGPAPGEPAPTEPGSAGPAPSEPGSGGPAPSGPGATDPGSGGPGSGGPGSGAPGAGGPGSGEPAPSEPGPNEPGPNGENPPGTSPDSEKILDTARGELGYQEGPGNANKYGPSAAWCSSFATWVWKQSGVDIPSLPFTGDVYNWGQERGLAYGADSLGQARPGDVLLFGTGPESPSTSTHIGIVESVDGDQVTMIEGNSSDQVQRVTHTLSGDTFYGGVHPR